MVIKLKQTTTDKQEEKKILHEENTAKFNQIKKILQGIEKRCQNFDKHKIKDLYGILTKEAIYVQGLGDIKGNKGMAPRGIDSQTLDGMNLNTIRSICDQIKSNTFEFQPVKRIYMPKKNMKMRPLGIPNFRDKLVQSAIKIILETIYEPEFERINKNYGFRPHKSGHDVIEKIKYAGTGCKLALEGDIVAAFDNINIKILIKILSKRIADKKFLNLIEQGCHCGMLDMGKYRETLIGVPQGGIASPILFNIYMHEFDKFMVNDLTNLVNNYNIECKRETNPIHKRWQKLNGKVQGFRNRLKTLLNKSKGVKNLVTNGTSKQKNLFEQLIVGKKTTNRLRLSLPSKVLSKRNIRFVYFRYADDWILLSNCKKEYMVKLKKRLPDQ